MKLKIRLERDDSIPAFAGFLDCCPPGATNHVILMNVQAVMAPHCEYEDGTLDPMSRDDRKRLIITSLMHEFGHALEKQFRLPFNEAAIEAACEQWETAYSKTSP